MAPHRNAIYNGSTGAVKVTSQFTEDCQAILRIEVSPEEFQRYLDRAYQRLVKRAEVPGFRKGRAPRVMLERYLGRQRLVQEALDIMVPEMLKEALATEGIQPFDRPMVEILQEEPPIIQATVPLPPQVDLGDYRQLRLPKQEVVVEREEVEAALEELRHRYAIRQPVDRPAQWGDIVRVDIIGEANGRAFYRDEDVEIQLRKGQQILVAGLEEAIVGARKGEVSTVELTMPQDWPRRSLAGRPATFTIRILEVKEHQLPPLDDSFAQQVGEGFPSLEALRQRLEEDIRQRKEMAAAMRQREEALDALVAAAHKVSFPPTLLEEEMGRLLQEEAQALGRDVDRYIEELRHSPQQRRQKLEERAKKRVMHSLVISRLAELEGIQVSDEEVREEIERLVTRSQNYQLLPLLQSPQGMASIRRSLLTRKTIDRLMEIVYSSDQGNEGGVES